jgi:hypothetical protein
LKPIVLSSLITIGILCTIGKAEDVKTKNFMVEHPEWYIKITDWSVYGTWGAVAIIHHVTIENTGDIAYKDIKIRVYYTSTSASQEGIVVSQETGFLPITLPPQSKGTYLKGGTTLGSGSQFMTPTRIEVLGATPVVN